MERLLIITAVLFVADTRYLLVQLGDNGKGKQHMLTAVLMLQILNYAAILQESNNKLCQCGNHIQYLPNLCLVFIY